MEQNRIREWFSEQGLSIDPTKVALICSYLDLVFHANKSFNLTSVKTKHEILENLIFKSMEPVLPLNVPRGTSFADIGSGQGVAGILLAILHEEFSGVLIDSNARKIEFLRHTIETLGIHTLVPLCGRVEEIAREQSYREQFDYLFSRAFGPVYEVIELGGPLLKQGGWLFIYSSPENESFDTRIYDHALQLGLMFPKEAHPFDIRHGGIVFRKVSRTDDRFPRRYATIRRESMRRPY